MLAQVRKRLGMGAWAWDAIQPVGSMVPYVLQRTRQRAASLRQNKPGVAKLHLYARTCDAHERKPYKSRVSKGSPCSESMGVGCSHVLLSREDQCAHDDSQHATRNLCSNTNLAALSQVLLGRLVLQVELGRCGEVQ